MACNGCADSVEKVLSALTAVESATVNLDAKEATVTYAESSVKANDLSQAVSDAGYTVTNIQ